MQQRYPRSAGLYNAAGTFSRVVQCGRDTQQGCTMLQGTHLPSAELNTPSKLGSTMLRGHPQSAGLYDAAQTLSVSRVVRCCTDTLSQQGCTMLHGYSQSAGLYDAARTLSVSRVVRCCTDTQSAGLYDAARTLSVSRVVRCCMDILSQQGCMMLHGHPQPTGLYDAAGLD